MNAETKCKMYGFTTKAAATLLALTIGAAPGVLAAPGSDSSVPVPGAIVAHLDIAGGPAARMRLAKKDGKRLLYVEMGSGQAVRVVDVTVPEKPGALEGSTGKQGVPKLVTAKVAANSPDILNLLNSIGTNNSQPAHTFSGTARFLTDAGHSLIFVVDGDGLWIVKAKQSSGEYTAPYDNADYGTTYGG